jgi:hypothetical protein
MESRTPRVDSHRNTRRYCPECSNPFVVEMEDDNDNED